MTGMVMSESGKGPRKSDKYIPLYFVGFFLVLFIMDGIFVYLATSTHTGVVEDHSYNRGLNYNDRIEEANAEAALGWQAGLIYDPAGKVSVTLIDDKGAAIEGADVRVQFFRPTHEGEDFTVHLTNLGSGNYMKDVQPKAGQWEVRVFASWKQQHYQITKRIFIAKK